ncbi:MAG: adenylate/guanylate cyclase domain-containing protein [Pseudomonadota bacterium]
MQGQPLPDGQVTILFTDIEASTAQWEAEPLRMHSAVSLHDELALKALSGTGVLIKRTGDGFNFVYRDARDAANAAMLFHNELSAANWPDGRALSVRIGFHTGFAQPLHGDYYGPTPNRAARVADVAHGGQIVCSATAAEQLDDDLIDLAGTYNLRGIGSQDIFFVGAANDNDKRDLSDRIKHTNLRPLHDAMFGRDRDLQQLAALLAPHSGLITLNGLGGVGKSRLAVEAGLERLPQYSDGVWLCELASTSSAEAVPDIIAKVLGAKRQPSLSVADSVVDFLRDKTLMLILDNCEHVKSAVVDILEPTLALPQLTVLATSREPLHIPGERIYNLMPLDKKASGQLFKARSAGDVSEQTTDAEVLEICEAVDGVPLAVELAAGWLSVYSADDIKQRLHKGSAGFLKERDGRQRIVLDTLAWSYQLLADNAARLFTRLCVFHGGFSLEAAQAVASDDLVDEADVALLLAELSEKSLVLSSRLPDGSRRFRVLEVLREFGRQKLVEHTELEHMQRRHVAYFRDFGARCNDMLVGTEEELAWQFIDRDWANVRAAINTALAQQSTDLAADIIVSLGWHAIYSVRVEVFDWALRLLRNNHIEDQPHYADLCGLAALGCYITVHPDAITWVERGLAASPKSPSLFSRTALLGVLVNNQLDSERAETVTKAWIDEVMQQAQPDKQEWVWAHGFRTFHLCAQQRLEDALPLSLKLQEHARWSGSASATAIACWAHGMTQLMHGLDTANKVWDDGVSWAQSLYGGHLLTHLIVGIQLHMSAGRADIQTVLVRCRDAIVAAKEQHYLAGTSHLFGVTAVALIRVNDIDTAAKLLGAMVANGHTPRPNALGYLRKHLGEETDTAMGLGAVLSIADAADIALQHLQKAIES